MESFTLTSAARVLGVPEHRLIHLCEQEVVVPDRREASGRGSSRRFSPRNLYEFAVALEMRRLELPVSFVRAVLRVLRTFERTMRSERAGFALPEHLLEPQAPQLTLMIVDGERLYFTLAPARGARLVFGGVAVRHPPARGRARAHRAIGRLKSAAARAATAEARTRIEVNLSRIARELDAKKSAA